jgi:hypothetical protein
VPIETAEDLAQMFDVEEFAVAALWRAGGAGAGVAVSVIRTRLPEPLVLGETRVRRDRSSFVVRASEVPGIAASDTLAIGADTFSVRDISPDTSGALLTLDCAKV